MVEKANIIRERAENLGIDSTYLTFDHQHIHVSEEILESLISLLERKEKAPDERKFASVFSLQAQQEITYSIADLLPICHKAELINEVGEHIIVELKDGQLTLPPLAFGYYVLTLSNPEKSIQALLIVAPETTYQPLKVVQGEKLAGINVQLYSLRSEENWGIGDLGDVYRLAREFSDDGIDFIGLNPLHALFLTSPEDASPYSPSSRRWLNVIYLDVAALPEFRLSPPAQKWFENVTTQQELKRLRATEWVDYSGVLKLKLTALRHAFTTFNESANVEMRVRRESFNKFCQNQGESLIQHAAFEALNQYFFEQKGVNGWQMWDQEYHDPSSKAVKQFIVEHKAEINFYMWLQWLMAQQLTALRGNCQALGVELSLYGDLAVGVARGGSDTWANQNLFCLDVSIGAPPDPLGPAGQNWGLPPFHPLKLRESGYLPFIEMLRTNMRFYGVLRIDHVMALFRLWWIVAGAKNASEGAYVHYPLEELLAILALESQRENCVVIGEDLGIVPPQVRTALQKYGIFSYGVMYFSGNEDAFLSPEEYQQHALAVVSTHDLAPLTGFWQHTDIETMNQLGMFPNISQYHGLLEQRTAYKKQILIALEKAGLEQHSDEINDNLRLAIHQFVAQSKSQLFAISLENLLPVTTSFNIPGIAEGYPNWRYRLPLNLSGDLSFLHQNIRQILNARQIFAKTLPTGGVDMSSLDHYVIESLLVGTCDDPFAYLGAHEAENGLIIRTLQPDADAVDLVSPTGELLAKMEKLDERGFFAVVLPEEKHRLVYRFAVYYGESVITLEDPYRFGSCLQEFDNWLLAEGTHLRPYEKMGAHRYEMGGVKGINFTVWCPNARRVSVVGDFNHWDGRRHAMRKHLESGIWEIFIPEVQAGALYKFEILDVSGAVRLKSDPYAFAAQLRPETASVVTPLPEKVPYNPERARANAVDAPISIYEVHLGSWRRNPENNFWLSYEELGDELISYVKEMGFTHIELLPLSEFPFDGSWGYQPLGLYAPTSRFGSPQGLVKFIEKAHAAGIYVLLDWVVGHFPTDEHGLREFDGTPLFEHADPKEGYHQDWNTLIYNFGRHEVRNYLTGNALYWVERYGIDGLRVDAVASMIYRDYSRQDGQWIPNQYGGRENLEAIEFLKRTNAILHHEQHGSVSVAEESTAFPLVSYPTEEGGLGFQFKWNMGWMNDTLNYMRLEPIHRKYHHNLLTFGMMYQYSEKFVLPLSHDEVVHGKGSLLAKMPGDCWQKFANLRAYYGYMWGYPGKKLLFMGNEFAQGREWNYEESLDWFLLDPIREGWHEGVQRWVRDLNHTYQQLSALWQQDCHPDGFEWLVVDDSEQSVVVFARHDRDGNPVIVACNFTPVPRHHYRFGVSQAGTYREVLNSDDTIYNGSGVNNGGAVQTEEIASHGKPFSLEITVPPLATVFFVLEKDV